MLKGRGRKKAYEKSFAQISAEVGPHSCTTDLSSLFCRATGM